ncbi:aminopeptidase M1-A-like [Pseudomyrmex gracilis]|uniref:aminopeptidase M1-A-like n=1 Tax=Pseudomyrmex gracilis TaxID=219809 RepID=UPI00099502F2|nr:aminopeptidase M1-A-like [Pseudomyrmex gracilis]XP_020287732.1 aminopeptidase M1-A-like [Pseudomyrmex gracilis]
MHKVKVVVSFLQLLFVSSILGVLVDAAINYDYRGTHTHKQHILPLYYKLDLKYLEENDFIIGESRITIYIQENTQQLSFDSFVSIDEINLYKIIPTNITLKETYTREYLQPIDELKSISYDQVFGFVIIDFRKIIVSGYYVLQIKFSESFVETMNTDGYIRVFNQIKGRWIIATQTQVEGPQAIFPCWDNPHFKIIFHVSICHSRKYEILFMHKNSSTELISRSHLIWTHFEPTPAVSAHCIDILVIPTYTSKWTLVPYNFTLTMLLRVGPSHKFAFDIIEEIIGYLMKQTLVDRCKVAHTTYISVRDFPFISLVTPSFALFSEEVITFSDKTPTDLQIMTVAQLLTETITYQWILRSTNPLYWSSSRLKQMSTFLVIYLPSQIFVPIYKKRYPSFQGIDTGQSLILDVHDINLILTSKTTPFSDI